MSLDSKTDGLISRISQFKNELRADFQDKKTTPALAAGVSAGLSLLVGHVAYASFIFSGPLAPYSSQGIGLILFGNFAACLIMAIAAGFRGVIAGLSPALVVGMAAFGSSIALQGYPLFVSVYAILMLTAVVTGISCFLIGRFGLANLLRFIPYPVSSGFIAGIGGAVCLAAMSLLGTEVHWNSAHELLEFSALVRWVPGVCYGVALYAASKKWSNPLILPASAVLVVICYHLALAWLGITGDEARQMGLLLTSTAEGNLWPTVGFSDVLLVDWMEVFKQLPNMLALILVAYICVVLNIAGLEAATNQELDWDKEFKAGGASTIVTGVGGGMIATIVIPASLRSKILGGTTRLTGIVAALVIAFVLFSGDGLLEYVPSLLVGGFLFFAGLGLLDQGLVRGWRQLPVSEFSIVVTIFVAIIAFGLLEGAGVGMLATLVLFAVRLSRVDVIRTRFTARERRSNRTLSIPVITILLEEGAHIQAFLLRGYVFFGSISSLVDRLRESFEKPVPRDCLLIDFNEITGFDFSAVNVLGRLLKDMDATGVNIVLSNLPDSLITGLKHNVPIQTFARFHIEINADRALERCEDIVIEDWKEHQTSEERATLLERISDDLVTLLAQQINFEQLIEKLPEGFDQRDYVAGERLTALESASADIQLLLSGHVSAYDADGIRLCQRGPGDVITSTRAMSEFVNYITADGACRTLLLTPATLNQLEGSDQELALELYRYLITRHF